MTAVLLLLELQAASPCAVQGEKTTTVLYTWHHFFTLGSSFIFCRRAEACLLRVTSFVVLVPYGTMHIFLRGLIQLSVEVKKLVSNNVSKDRSFQRYLVLDILTNPHSFYTRKEGNILEKNPLPTSLFTFYSLKIKFVPFLKGWPATIPCKIKWATKLLLKKKGKGEKRQVQILACAHAWKTKKLFNDVRLVEKNLPF